MFTKDAILRQAAEVLFMQGYGHTRLEDVAAHIGITRPYLYYHFHNKDDLVMQLIDWAESDFYQLTIREAAKANDPISAMSVLVDNIQRLMREQHWKSGCLLGMLAQELASQNEVFRKRLNQAFDRLVEEFAVIFEPYKASGLLVAEFDSQEAGESMLNVLQGAILMARTRRHRRPLDEARVMMTAYLRNFYAGSPANQDLLTDDGSTSGNA